MVQFYAERLGIGWEWQSIDSGTCPVPLSSTQTGKNPTDCSKSDSKIYILVEEGAFRWRCTSRVQTNMISGLLVICWPGSW